MPRPVRRSEVNGSGQGASELGARASGRVPLPPALRAVVYAVAALLWVSGTLWLVLHYTQAQASAFGPLPNPWEAPLMRTHGIIGVGAVFLIGWMTAVHVSVRWAGERKRRSGLALAGTALLLVLSGYALYYTIGFPHDVAARLHEALGVLAPAAALAHWWRNRSRD
jgi:hypothetical protein